MISIYKLIPLMSLNCRSLSRRSKSERGMDEQKSNCEENDSEPTGKVHLCPNVKNVHWSAKSLTTSLCASKREVHTVENKRVL